MLITVNVVLLFSALHCNDINLDMTYRTVFKILFYTLLNFINANSIIFQFKRPGRKTEKELSPQGPH